jgi:hypothetical protein
MHPPLPRTTPILPKKETTKSTHALLPPQNQQARKDSRMITGIHHVNLVVPAGTLEHANAFYGETLGLTPRVVPQLQRETLAWFDIGSSGQYVVLPRCVRIVRARHRTSLPSPHCART